MMEQKGLVSIVIVNWNTRELLLGCIQSIRDNAAGLPCEIIVVDNASGDDSVEAVRGRFPEVKLIANDRNLGFAAANNLGIISAAGELVMLLNPDTIVGQGAVGKMRDFLLEHPKVGAVGCALINPDGTPQESYWMSFPSPRWLLGRALYADKLFRRIAPRKEPVDGSPFPVAHLLGACIMARRSLIAALDGFDESYFMYLEETDLCYRMMESGFQIYHLPNAQVVHFGQASSNQAAEWTNVELYASMYKFMRAHQVRTRVGSWSIRGTLVMCGLVRLVLWSVRFIARSRDRSLARRMLRGYWRLIVSAPGFEATCARTRRAAQPRVWPNVS